MAYVVGFFFYKSQNFFNFLNQTRHRRNCVFLSFRFFWVVVEKKHQFSVLLLWHNLLLCGAFFFQMSCSFNWYHFGVQMTLSLLMLFWEDQKTASTLLLRLRPHLRVDFCPSVTFSEQSTGTPIHLQTENRQKLMEPIDFNGFG